MLDVKGIDELCLIRIHMHLDYYSFKDKIQNKNIKILIK